MTPGPSLRSFPIAACLAATLGLATPSAAGTFALIVGNNHSLDAADKPLRFADDDAARYEELFKRFGAKTVLLAVLDVESQRLFPESAASARAPTRANLVSAIDALNREIEREGSDGRATTFVFVFVGHGSVSGGMGYVSLLDERFTRANLFRDVVSRSKATFNHVIIDACDSYFMVNARGGGDERGPDHSARIAEYVLDEDLSRHPNTGVLLSTSKRQESHEWEGFRAGVFSHEVRSALLGAADVNEDGQVEYSEVAAFIQAANASLDDPRARTALFARAPALDLHRPVVDLSGGGRQFIALSSEVAGRFFLEDARGVRVGDFHKASGNRLVLAPPPSPLYYLRGTDREAKLVFTADGTLRVAAGSFRSQSLAARGSLSEELDRRLFSVPYGRSFYDGFAAQMPGVPVRRPERPFPPRELALPPGVVSPLMRNPY